MKKLLSIFLLLSCITVQKTAAVGPLAGLVLKSGARVITTTAAVGPSFMSLLIAGTVVAIGQEELQKNNEGRAEEPTTLNEVVEQWKVIFNNGKTGFEVIEKAIATSGEKINFKQIGENLYNPAKDPVISDQEDTEAEDTEGDDSSQ